MGLTQFVAPRERSSENMTPPGVATPYVELPSKAVESALHAKHEGPTMLLHTGVIVLASATW
jgi:hypothetical protein